MPWSQKQRLVTLLQQKAISLIEDDVYGELYFGAERLLPAKALDQHRQILHCSSFLNAWRRGSVWGGWQQVNMLSVFNIYS